jgi:transposase
MEKKESKLVKFILRLFEAAQSLGIRPYGSKFSRKDYTQYQHLALLVLKEKMEKGYRETIEYVYEMPEVMAALGLEELPHFTTLQKFLQRIKAFIIELLILQIALMESIGWRWTAAIDATGYTSSYASKYYQKRLRQKVTCRSFLKSSILIHTPKQLVLVLKNRVSPSNDSKDFIPLLKKARRLGLSLWRIVGDKGYDGEKNLEFVQRDLRAEAIIPIKEGQSTPSKSKRRKRLLKLWRSEPAKTKRKYHRRSLVETVNSVVKRLFGEELRSRSIWLRKKELNLKYVAYNLHRIERLSESFAIALVEVFYAAE